MLLIQTRERAGLLSNGTPGTTTHWWRHDDTGRGDGSARERALPLGKALLAFVWTIAKSGHPISVALYIYQRKCCPSVFT